MHAEMATVTSDEERIAIAAGYLSGPAVERLRKLDSEPPPLEGLADPDSLSTRFRAETFGLHALVDDEEPPAAARHRGETEGEWLPSVPDDPQSGLSRGEQAA
jgi:hypothetical protein